MKCSNCPYSWAEFDGDIPFCHYTWNDGYAPCEVEED